MAFSIEALHAALTAADPSYRGSPAVLRLSRLMADLDFRARTPDADGALAEHARAPSRPSSARSMPTSPAATLATPPRPPPARPRRMHFAIRYLTEYRYERARSRTT